MPYNGRAVMKEAATRHGWRIITDCWPEREDKVEFDLYLRGPDEILVGWTPVNTAPYVGVNGEEITGMGALIAARRVMEKEKD